MLQDPLVLLLRRRHTGAESDAGALKLNRSVALRQALTNENSRRGRGETSHWSEPVALRQIGSVSGVRLPVQFVCDRAFKTGSSRATYPGMKISCTGSFSVG